MFNESREERERIRELFSRPDFMSRAYSVWCILLGIVTILVLLYYYLKRKNELAAEFEIDTESLSVIFVIYGLLCFTYVIAGIQMLFGMRQNTGTMFIIGKVLSYIFPIAESFLVVPLIVHICAVFKLCKFKEQRWNYIIPNY